MTRSGCVIQMNNVRVFHITGLLLGLYRSPVRAVSFGMSPRSCAENSTSPFRTWIVCGWTLCPRQCRQPTSTTVLVDLPSCSRRRPRLPDPFTPWRMPWSDTTDHVRESARVLWDSRLQLSCQRRFKLISVMAFRSMIRLNQASVPSTNCYLSLSLFKDKKFNHVTCTYL